MLLSFVWPTRLLFQNASMKNSCLPVYSRMTLSDTLCTKTQGYREERRKLLFSNLPSAFQNPDAPLPVEGTETEQVQSDDPIQDKVEHFLFDKILFFKYCMIEGHSALQSGKSSRHLPPVSFETTTCLHSR